MIVRSSNYYQISDIGEYSGYSEPIYSEVIRHSLYVEVSDGCKLALDYLIPAVSGVEVEEPLPVIFNFTPYGRVKYGKGAKFFNPFAKQDIEDDEIVIPDNAMEGIFDLWKYGYVIAIADVRGTGASYGVRHTTNSRREALDGKELVEWLSSQHFCSGKVGTIGMSYHGATQLELLSLCPKGLAACFIGCTDFDKYDGWFRGGIPRAFGSEPDIIYGQTDNQIVKTVETIVENTVPVDEDQDRSMLREAIWQHVENGRQIPIMRDLKWRNSYLKVSGGNHWEIISSSSYIDEINSSGAAVYIVGGNYDIFRKETISLWHNLTLPRKLLIGPWYHTTPKVNVSWSVEALRWFDHWLKGIDNGIERDPAVTFKVTSYDFKRRSYNSSGTGYYRTEDDWPVSGGKRKLMFANEDGLSDSPAGEGVLEYSVQYGCVTSSESQFTSEPSGPPYMPVRPVPDIEKYVADRIGCVFDTKPLSSELSIIGHPIARVSLSLDDPGWMERNYDTDVFVLLSDYDPDTDTSFLVSEGQLRASLRRESDCEIYYTSGLPWHRCFIGDNEWMEKDVRYDLTIDLMPVAYKFKKGHCIRMTLTNSLNNTYYHGKAEYESDHSIKLPVIKYYLGTRTATRIELPNIYA